MILYLKLNQNKEKYKLVPYKKIYTKFDESIKQITIAKPGDINQFKNLLKLKMRDSLDVTSYEDQ